MSTNLVNHLKKGALNITIILTTTGFGACHHVIQNISVDSYRDEIAVPTQSTQYGSTYSYEHKIRGDLLFQSNDFADAAEEYELAIGGDPSNTSLRCDLSSALLKLKDFSRARFHISKAIMYNPADGEAWYLLAQLHQKEGNTSQSLEAASYGAQVDRENISNLRFLAEYWTLASQTSDKQPENLQNALHYYQLAMVRNPREVDLYLAAALLCNKLQYPDMGARYLRKYLSLRGNDIRAVNELVDDYLANKHYHSAIAVMQSQLRLNPYDDALRTRLLNTYFKANDSARAAALVYDFWSDPTTPDQIVTRTNWLCRAGRLWEARTLLVEQFSAAPLHPLVRLQLAQIEAQLMRKEIAASLLEFPGGEWPQNYQKDVDELHHVLQLQRPKE